MKLSKLFLLLLSSCLLFVCALCFYLNKGEVYFTSHEYNLLSQSLLDPRLRDPDSLDQSTLDLKVIELGEKLFNDNRLSKNKEVSCAKCHVPNRNFQDVNRMSEKINSDSIRALSLRGVKDQYWFFWDGRVDSLWSQALEALENDHGLKKNEILEYVCTTYKGKYTLELELCDNEKSDDQLIVAIGRTIEAYVSSINHYWTRFDEFVYQYIMKDKVIVGLLSEQEIAGAKLFFDSQKTGCIDCHSGYRFTNGGFYAIGTGKTPNYDRQTGGQKYKINNYKCQNWQESSSCIYTKYARIEGADLKGAFKVPSLRNLKDSPAFMHDGRFGKLEEVIDYYINPYSYPLTHTDIRPLRLMPHERQQLLAFLKVLNEEYYTSTKKY